MEKITVSLGERSYDIIIEAGGIARLGAFLGGLRLGAKCAIITDPRVKDLCGPLVTNSLADAGLRVDVVTFPEGEENKTLATVERLYHEMLSLGLDRKSFVVALGGGLVGDVAGFAAATYMRGIRFVQVPTTLLAQVDASVGGKVGVNLPEGKNLVGSFHQPSLVLIDPDVLRTLDGRDLKAGFAEVIKYGIIRDADFFSFLEENWEAILSLEPSAVEKAIAISCRIKAAVVAEDEREESGLRAILNFGHTVAHAIEALSDYRTYRHGEAVAIGMAVAAEISERLGHLPKGDADRIESLLKSVGLPVTFSGLDIGQLVSRMRFDKKAVRDKIRFVLAKKVGEVFLTDDVPLDTLSQVLRKRSER
ncbi:MAG: 3-dehydroquinate synthase [bacterium]|nr:3-dehydroquinate synthase [bacterium]